MVWITAVLVSSCAAGPERRTAASYDTFTSQLLQLSADQNGDGRPDQWSYLDGNRPIRGEGDADGDGRIDRWEYFGADGSLIKVGTSSRNDGIEDTWAWAAPTAEGENLIAHARKRDRQIDRREFYRGSGLIRVEEDTNADGRVDKWERFEGAVLREAAVDTSLAHGKADRRLIYDGQGRFEKIETDPERDGTFVELPGEAARGKAGVQ
jgi:hypothetical protein